MAAPPKISRQTKPPGSFGGLAAPAGGPSINRQSKPPSASLQQDPAANSFKAIASQTTAEQAKFYLDVYWHEIDAQTVAGEVRSRANLFERIQNEEKELLGIGGKDTGWVSDGGANRFLEMVEGIPPQGGAPILHVLGYLAEVALPPPPPPSSAQASTTGGGLTFVHYLVFHYKKDWKKMAQMWHKREGGPKGLKAAEEHVEACRAQVLQAQYASYAASQARDELERALEEVRQQENARDARTRELQELSKGEGVQANRAKNELAQHLAEDPLPLRRAKITLEAALRKANRATTAATKAKHDAEASLLDAEEWLKREGKGDGSEEGTRWWLQVELFDARRVVDSLPDATTDPKTKHLSMRATQVLQPLNPNEYLVQQQQQPPQQEQPPQYPPPQQPTPQQQPPQQQQQRQGRQQRRTDFSSALILDKLSLEGLEDDSSSKRGAAAAGESKPEEGDPGAPSTSSSTLRRLREAEERSAATLESLHRQQVSLSNVGYKLEDIDRTLVAGDHYLDACDGYLGAFKTTISGPELHGKDMSRGEGGEPPMGPDGQPLRYGTYGWESGTTQAPQLVQGSQYAHVPSTGLSSRADQQKIEAYRQQEQDLAEINASLQNISAMSKTTEQELRRQEKQISAVSAKQNETAYNIEKSTHKLDKLL